MKTVDALVVTSLGTQPAQLSIGDTARDGDAVLLVNGIARPPDSLPAGAYVQIDDPTMADQAAAAGFFIEPADSQTRRKFKLFGRMFGAGLAICTAIGLYWALVHLLALDLVGALVWLGLSALIAAGALYFWRYGEEFLLQEQAGARLRSRRIRTAVKGPFGSGRRKR